MTQGIPGYPALAPVAVAAAPAPVAPPPAYAPPVAPAAPATPAAATLPALPPGYSWQTQPDGSVLPVAAAPVAAAPVAPPVVAQAAPFDMGAAIALASGDGPPQPTPGIFRFEVLGSILKQSPPGKPLKQTFIATLRVIESNNPAYPPGAEAAYVEGTGWAKQQERIRDMIINSVGYPSQAALEHAYAAAGQDPLAALTALCGAAMKSEGNPLTGRHVCAVVTENTRTNDGQTKTYKNWAWSPAA